MMPAAGSALGKQKGRADRGPVRLETALVGGALVVSVGLIWLVAGGALVPLAYAGGVAVLGSLALLLSRRAPGATRQAVTLPDWSVTVAAIEQPGIAVAITDRANRLTCANSAFTAAFGIGHAPPGLPVGEGGIELLTRLARSAWRDGAANLDRLEHAGTPWAIEAKRAGLADDYLIWRFAPLRESDPLGEIGARIVGLPGEILSHAGIELALPEPAR